MALTGDDRPTAPAPSWAKVIATTMRLWWQRRFGRPWPGRTAGKRAGLVVLLLALVAASATAVQTGFGGTAARPAASPRPWLAAGAGGLLAIACGLVLLARRRRPALHAHRPARSA